MSVFMPTLHCFDYHSFVAGFEIRKSESSNFVLLFQDCLGSLGTHPMLDFIAHVNSKNIYWVPTLQCVLGLGDWR